MKNIIKRLNCFLLALVAVFCFSSSLLLTSCAPDDGKSQSEQGAGGGGQSQTETQKSVNKIENAVDTNSEYSGFSYEFVMYTYTDEVPTIYVNGTAKKNGESVYLKLGYTVSQENYDLYVGYGLDVKKVNEKYKISNSGEGKTEAEIVALNELTAEISSAEPTTALEMTYEEYLASTVAYLRKKTGLVLCEGFELVDEGYVSETFKLNLYFDNNGTKGDLEFDKYEVFVKQLKIDMITTTDQNGQITYTFDPSKTYNIVTTRRVNENQVLSSSEYLDLYIGNKQNIEFYERLKNNGIITLKFKSDHGNIYNSYEQEI